MSRQECIGGGLKEQHMALPAVTVRNATTIRKLVAKPGLCPRGRGVTWPRSSLAQRGASS